MCSKVAQKLLKKLLRPYTFKAANMTCSRPQAIGSSPVFALVLVLSGTIGKFESLILTARLCDRFMSTCSLIGPMVAWREWPMPGL
jgi:hypothetical protein